VRDASFDNVDAFAGIVAVELGEKLRLIWMITVFAGGRYYPPMNDSLTGITAAGDTMKEAVEDNRIVVVVRQFIHLIQNVARDMQSFNERMEVKISEMSRRIDSTITFQIQFSSDVIAEHRTCRNIPM
jgi:hypothetical protein